MSVNWDSEGNYDDRTSKNHGPKIDFITDTYTEHILQQVLGEKIHTTIQLGHNKKVLKISTQCWPWKYIFVRLPSLDFAEKKWPQAYKFHACLNAVVGECLSPSFWMLSFSYSSLLIVHWDIIYCIVLIVHFFFNKLGGFCSN